MDLPKRRGIMLRAFGQFLAILFGADYLQEEECNELLQDGEHLASPLGWFRERHHHCVVQ